MKILMFSNEVMQKAFRETDARVYYRMRSWRAG